MPYYPEDQSEENIKKLRQNNVCAECGRQLYAYFDLKNKQTYLACPTLGHGGITREYRPPVEDYESNIRREIELEKEQGREASRALATIPKQGQLTQPQAEHILSLVYPGVPKDEIIRCAILCRDFGLHPLMKEVYIIGFKNKSGGVDYTTVIGISASRKMAADRKGAYSFLDGTPRAATPEEIIKQYGKNSDEERNNLISICVLRGERGNEATGFGLWPKEKVPYGTDKGNTGRNMANIRSERPAYSRLPGAALPPIEVIDEAYAEVPDIGRVNTSTGEIIEGEARALEPEDAPSLAHQPKEHWCSEHNCAFELKKSRYGSFYAHKKPEGGWCNEKKKAEASKGEAVAIATEQDEPEPGPERDPTTIKTLNELYKACNEDFKLQPAQVIAELGVSSQSDISDTPEECYRKIAAVRK